MSCYYCTGGDVVCRECGREQSEYIVGLERAHAGAKVEIDRLRAVIEHMMQFIDAQIEDNAKAATQPPYNVAWSLGVAEGLAIVKRYVEERRLET